MIVDNKGHRIPRWIFIVLIVLFGIGAASRAAHLYGGIEVLRGIPHTAAGLMFLVPGIYGLRQVRKRARNTLEARSRSLLSIIASLLLILVGLPLIALGITRYI